MATRAVLVRRRIQHERAAYYVPEERAAEPGQGRIMGGPSVC